MIRKKELNNPIIPVDQIFYDKNSFKIIDWDEKLNIYDLDFKAIIVFCSLGFMLDDSTFYKNIKTLKPSTNYSFDKNKIIKSNKYWNWSYNPIERSFSDIVDEFTCLFNNIINKRTQNKSILLPVSGGLDSRTLFAPIKDKKEVTLCSYEFENGFNESETSKKISNEYQLPLYVKKITKGYLWSNLSTVANLNNCFTDFIHPRQIAVINDWKKLGDSVLLGHWGDVLFDKHSSLKKTSLDNELLNLKNQIIKPGGLELASDLWLFYGFEGSFINYITELLLKLYQSINIDHPSARMRAFKSLYWAPRWTSVNLSIFATLGEIVAPYYSNELCDFICGVDEYFLDSRKIQIEYLKKQCSKIAGYPWQKYYPLNLYNYNYFYQPLYYPARLIRKLKRILQDSDIIERNWELQFLGKNNIFELEKNLLNTTKENFIPDFIIKKYLNKFNQNSKKYAHSISMILTLNTFSNMLKR